MIKERIVQLIETKRVPKEKFFSDLGITSANFRGSARLTPVNSDIIAKIFAVFPDINLEWLITGEGQMLKQNASEDEPKDMVSLKTYEAKVEECVRLRMEIDAMKEAAARYAEERGVYSGITSPVEA